MKTNLINLFNRIKSALTGTVYMKAVKSAAVNKIGWENELTEFGKQMLSYFQNKEKW